MLGVPTTPGSWLGTLMKRYFGRKVEASRLIRVQAKEESLRLTSTTPISLIWVRLDPNSRGIMVDKVWLISKSVLTELFVTRSGMRCSRKVWSKPSLGLIPIMLLIRILGHTVPCRVNRPFRMEAKWFTNPTFENVIVNAWTGNSILIILKILLQLLLCGINKNFEIFLGGKDGSWLD